MNNSVVNLDLMTHQAVQLLLPWLPTGTLDPAEQALVQSHLEACTQCQADLALQRAWSAAQPPVPAGFDADRAFAKLLPRLGPPQQPGALREWLQRVASVDRAWKWTVAGQFAVIGVLGVMLARPGPDAGGAYRGLGAAAPAQGAVVVVFRPNTPERELRRIVRASGARLVDGPTAADGFVLDVPAASLKVALAHLRAEPAILLAQPLVGALPP